MGKIKIKEYPIFTSIVITEIIAVSIGLIYMFASGITSKGYYSVWGINEIIGRVFQYAIMILVLGILLIYPLTLTCINIWFLIKRKKDERILRIEKNFEALTLVLGILFSFAVLALYEIEFLADWTKVLTNNQVHTPIWTESYLTIFIIATIGIVGYLILALVPIEKMPPLVIVVGISALYIGMGLCILWIIQIFSEVYLILGLLPLNFIIIGIKTIKNKVYQWNKISYEEKKRYNNKVLRSINERLMESWKWPIVGFLLMWPLLGILICILAIFGQEPDSFIKAWTETSDWNLSNRIAPQNIQVDEHYLCTVAAGGHKTVVKPFRLGKRHGHEVIVNRQLCIANAFEQILEEKIPKVHRRVRNFYDTYGFPIAKLIHSPYIADVIYFLMKPLEWFFLMVIYLCDVKPENRIAVQYLPISEIKGETFNRSK